jgi:hypothetical protein
VTPDVKERQRLGEQSFFGEGLENRLPDRFYQFVIFVSVARLTAARALLCLVRSVIGEQIIPAGKFGKLRLGFGRVARLGKFAEVPCTIAAIIGVFDFWHCGSPVPDNTCRPEEFPQEFGRSVGPSRSTRTPRGSYFGARASR